MGQDAKVTSVAFCLSLTPSNTAFPVGPLSHYDFQRRCPEPVDFFIVCCRKRHEKRAA